MLDRGEGNEQARETGLLMVWSDIDAEFGQNSIAGRTKSIYRGCSRSGLLSAGRYVDFEAARKYLAMDKLEDHNVLRTTPYVDTVTYQLAPQRERIGTNRVRRNFLRTYIGKSFRCTHTRLRLLYYGVNYDPMY